MKRPHPPQPVKGADHFHAARKLVDSLSSAPNIQEWGDEFDDLFPNLTYEHNGRVVRLKDFIRNLLSSHHSKLIAELEERLKTVKSIRSKVIPRTGADNFYLGQILGLETCLALLEKKI